MIPPRCWSLDLLLLKWNGTTHHQPSPITSHTVDDNFLPLSMEASLLRHSAVKPDQPCAWELATELPNILENVTMIETFYDNMSWPKPGAPTGPPGFQHVSTYRLQVGHQKGFSRIVHHCPQGRRHPNISEDHFQIGNSLALGLSQKSWCCEVAWFRCSKIRLCQE